MTRTFLKSGLAALLLMTGSATAMAESMRLEWVLQGQFAGPIVALEKGYYKEAGVGDFLLQPAGPDLKPTVMVATGVDTFGIGHPNQVIAARANGVPLVMVSQWGQKSATTYVARKDSGIASVADMAGHSVGLWFGGDEHEFMAMLKKAGVDPAEVTTISQGYDIIAWLNGEYEVMQVTRYNELLLVYQNGFKPEDLVYLDAGEAGAEFISGGLFTTEAQIAEHPETVQAVVNASLRGWKEAFADPEAAAEIVVKYNSELDKDFQVEQIKQMRDIACAGPTLEGKFGETRLESWELAQEILLGAGLIDQPIDLSTGYTNSFVDAAPADYRTILCE
ncbi:ABC transporter substrate-binding protein [Rhodobacter sp. SGA-6-6]|uniref:ABC transporter substrate-binding protein n=1 Tax=Rhodobacter sp. SGA-6-6 TaxID=2710882 RepID=UPI0013EBF85A|nr:ABC transporter substrate-binding protein [Rhodobacter sp. SGA-6-6]NGM44528.1 ABC transporter substrate-binding protein [Rhodobacter sp. SGA-6-6]